MPAQRVRIDKASPRIYKQMVAVTGEVAAAAADAGIGRDVVELVNLRCSQLNGCAYCLDLHARAGRAAGLTDQQLDVVAAWREAPALFDDVQRAALEIAELVTAMPPRHAADIAYDRATDVLDEAQTSVLIWAAVTINAFNRVSVVSGYEVRHRV